MLLLVREAVVLIAVAIATFTDLKTGLINDWLTLPLIAFGIIVNLVEMQLWGFAIAGIVFALFYALYFLGKIGGGDVKLFTGMALTLPFLQGLPFIVSVLLWSAVSAIMVLAVYYTARLLKEKKFNWRENKKGISNALMLGIALIVYFQFVIMQGFIGLNGIIMLAVPITCALVFLALEQSIRKNFFLKKIKLSEVEEDELIAWEFLDEKTSKQLGKLKVKGIIDEKLKEKLKELKVQEIPVFRNLPKFAPFILIGTIISLAFPNIFLIITW